MTWQISGSCLNGEESRTNLEYLTKSNLFRLLKCAHQLLGSSEKMLPILGRKLLCLSGKCLQSLVEILDC